MDHYSIVLREHLVAILLGLGLPIPALHRKELWGYERDYDLHIYFPIASAMDALNTAFDMSDSRDYHTDDIVAWINEATKIPMSRRTFFLLKKERPLFPEYNLSLEERIKIFNGQSAPAPSKETIEKENKRQAYHQERARRLAQGDGKAEGSAEARDDS